MITKNSYRVRTLPEKHSFERFGYPYQPVLIEGTRAKQNRTDFIGLRCYEVPFSSNKISDTEEKVFILNHQTREMTRNRFDLKPGCKLIFQDSLFECVGIDPHEKESYHPAVLVKRLPFKECYREPFADYLDSLASTGGDYNVSLQHV